MKIAEKEQINRTFSSLKKINTVILIFVLILFGYYIYQTISISSGSVRLVNLKKDFLERKNNLTEVISNTRSGNFDPELIKANLKMAEIEKFDYIIIGPSEFALTKEEKTESNRQ